MADFIQREEDLEQEDQEELFNLGDKQYTQDELNRLVGLGETATELESKWNTKIDGLYSGFTKKSQAVKEYEEKIAELEGEIATKNTPALPEDEEQAIRQAKEAARKIGIVLKDDLDTLGYVKKDEYGSLYSQQRSGEKILEDVRKMESEIDGKDGRPAFDSEKVLEFMKENNISNPTIAYKLQNEEALDAWKESKYRDARKPGVVTLDGRAGGKQPANVRPNKDNLSDLVSQALEGKL